MKVCGNSDCSISTGIHEGLTFGSGELDSYGYWERPCRFCAQNFDDNIHETRRSIYLDHIERGESHAEAMRYIQESDWLNLKAWPFSNENLEELSFISPEDNEVAKG